MMNRLPSSSSSSSSVDPYSIFPFASSFDNWNTQFNYTHNHTPQAFDGSHQPPPPPPPPPPPHSLAPLPFYSPHLSSDYFIKREDHGNIGSRPIGLNLGHRTYFSSGDGLAIDHRLIVGRAHHHHQPPRCQAEGCKADLSGAKHYHRRHKVCEFHSKAAVVVAGGLQQRFCQQCSR